MGGAETVSTTPKPHRLRNRLLLLGILTVLASVGLTQGRGIWEFVMYETVLLDLNPEDLYPFVDDRGDLYTVGPSASSVDRAIVVTRLEPRWFLGREHDVEVWDVETGRRIATPPRSKSGVFALVRGPRRYVRIPRDPAERAAFDKVRVRRMVALEFDPDPERSAPWIRSGESFGDWYARMLEKEQR